MPRIQNMPIFTTNKYFSGSITMIVWEGSIVSGGGGESLHKNNAKQQILMKNTRLLKPLSLIMTFRIPVKL